MSSNKEILTTSLLVSTVVGEAKEGYSIGVEVADGILEVSADSRVVSPLFLGQTLLMSCYEVLQRGLHVSKRESVRSDWQH